jgi:hypothetical protein
VKKLFLILLIVSASIAGRGQASAILGSTNKIDCLQGSCTQTLNTTSGYIAAFISAKEAVAPGGGLTFKLASGPNTPVMGTPIVSWNTGNADTTSIPIAGLIPGTYVWNITGTTVSGATASVTASVIVVPPVVTPKFLVRVMQQTIKVYSDSSQVISNQTFQ